jgi:hypothetical protein
MKIRSLGLLLSLAVGFSVLPFSPPASAALYLTNLKIHLDASNASSYSGSGGNWNDLSGQGSNFTLSATAPTFINTAPKNFQLTKSNSGGTFFSGSNSWLGGQDFTAICTYRPSNHSYVTITATLNPDSSFYIGTVTSSAQYLVSRRVGRR